ncbi:T9SS type A sorting domain-containing protein [Mangrovivirga cuniculi]|uniref:PKD domain-containing protein n=1 Tax=Mangrovivirga cuniculi TaxID=2715131 RepID=A0A4D7JHQ8_9BACT|nr:T9SS type A sorting domain-containing protein [Mangrovivirga cuniculi]QCK14543.1 hypothetical protein DCC35_07195 [Mangrovivirga cuniculi]
MGDSTFSGSLNYSNLNTNVESVSIYVNLSYLNEYTDIDGSTNCIPKPNNFTANTRILVAEVNLKDAPNPDIDLPNLLELCDNDQTQNDIVLSFNATNGTPNPDNGVYNFIKNGVINRRESDYFSGEAIGPGEYQLFYEYLGDVQFCNQKSDTIEFTVNETPEITIDYDDGCVGEPIAFSNSINNLTTSELQGAQYIWSFGDGDRDSVSNSLKSFSNDGPYAVELQVTTADGCTGFSARSFVNISQYPIVDFSYFGACSGRLTNLKPIIINEEEISIDSVRWNVENILYTESYTDSIDIALNSSGFQPINLEVFLESGCNADTTKNIFIQPVINVYNYIEDFDDEIYQGWVSTGQIDNSLTSSWLENDTWLGKNGVWATNRNSDSYHNNESSYLESPCFILDDTQVPMLDLDIASKTDIQADGVVIEYTLDGGRTWIKLGKKDSGLGWYNAANLLGAPGSEGNNITREGWAGDFDWQKAAFQLDDVKFDANGQPVKFRLMFGSNADNPFGIDLSGFGINKFSIVERNRTMVIESFLSNVPGDNMMSESVTYLDNLLEGKEDQVIDIRYHINSPNQDPVFPYNTADFSAKRLHYGIDVAPRTVFDGYFDTDVDHPIQEENYGADVYDRRSLVSSPFNIDLNVTENPDKLDIEVRITKNITGEDIEDDLVLMVGMVQKEFELDGTMYKNVLRKFIPNAGGTTIIGDWIDEDTTREEIVNLTWMTDYYSDLNVEASYRLVAYLFRAQDIEQTKEIVQGAFYDLDNGLPAPNIITSVDDEFISGDYLLYPNPANEKLTIRVPEQFSGKAEYSIYSLHGNLVESGVIKRTNSKQINTFNFSPGMYYIQIMEEGKNTPVTKKFSIIK